MPDQYSPKHFLRQVSYPLLREFFVQRGELVELGWDSLAPDNIEPIYDAWQALPDRQQTEIESVFRAIWSLATKEGLRTVIEESRFHQLDLQASLDRFHGAHEKLLWLFIHHNKVFASAGRLNQADQLSKRYWRLRNDLPAKKPDISHATRDLLKSEISRYFETEQGRGKDCTVEVYLRREGLHYFFCYPSDYADTALVYEAGGKLTRQYQKAAFQVIFAYNELTGALDVFVHGDKRLRQDLEEIFCRLILQETFPDSKGRPPYNLAPLRSGSLSFLTDPKDNIRETRVKALRFSVASPGLGRITFESDERRKRGSVYDLITAFLKQADGAVYVTQAVMEVNFRTGAGDKTVRFTITHPDSCTLKDEPEHLIIKDYLRQWGIARKGDA